MHSQPSNNLYAYDYQNKNKTQRKLCGLFMAYLLHIYIISADQHVQYIHKERIMKQKITALYCLVYCLVYQNVHILYKNRASNTSDALKSAATLLNIIYEITEPKVDHYVEWWFLKFQYTMQHKCICVHFYNSHLEVRRG